MNRPYFLALSVVFGLMALPATASDVYQWQQLNSQQQRILKQYEMETTG